MLIDWLTLSQEFDFDLPAIGDKHLIVIDSLTGERLSERQTPVKYEGSHSTSIRILISGRKLRVEGNPSKIDRLDNLFGYATIEQCIQVYNRILTGLGLPGFSRCTRLEQRQTGKSVGYWSDGACIERLDLTTNVGVGEGNVLAYLRGLATQRIDRSISNLYRNGRTVDWQSIKGGSRLQYRKAYDKGFELELHALPRAKRKYGEDSAEYKYIDDLIKYCSKYGVVRFEQELKSEYLKREGLRYWGLFDESRLTALHSEFLRVDEKLEVTAMDTITIAQHLLEKGIVSSQHAANTTASYALNWSHGQTFDFEKSSVKTHRARLRKIGIDIANPCDTSLFSPVIVTKAREITKTYSLPVPDWYQKPVHHLKLVA